MVDFIPIVKINQPSVRDIGTCGKYPLIAIRAQDLLKERSGELNKTYYEIKAAGGIHNLPGFEFVRVILIFVMTDELITKVDEWKAALMINTVLPDYYSTFDCETYEGENETSVLEIKKSLNLTIKLLLLCPNINVIGHVKGCSRYQVIQHTIALRRLGIREFLFHTGDFFRNKNKEMMERARMYAYAIRPYADKLYLCGQSHQGKLIQFSFADAYLSMAYLTLALKGFKLVGTKRMRYSHENYKDIACKNLKQMERNVRSIDEQLKLIVGGEILWETAIEIPESLILEPKTHLIET